MNYKDYYCRGGMNVDDIISNVIKYVLRAGKKTPDMLPDLIKALNNLDKEIQEQQTPVSNEVVEQAFDSLVEDTLKRKERVKVPVVFDFDGTLQRRDVQRFASTLEEYRTDVCEIEMWIMTARYNDLLLSFNNFDFEDTNSEVWEVADRIGIPHRRVIFTNLEAKVKHLRNTKVALLLDDKKEELERFENILYPKVVDATEKGFPARCYKAIDNYIRGIDNFKSQGLISRKPAYKV